MKRIAAQALIERRGLGQRMWRLRGQDTRAGELPAALRTALTHDGPALIDVDVDPNEPPLPGKVSYEQAKSFAQSWLRGQPHEAAMASTMFKDRISQLHS